MRIKQRLNLVAKQICTTLQNKLKFKPGFTTTIGISTNPMLSKLASDLQKPYSVNVLYPWYAKSIISTMPLRKVPGFGSKTLKSFVSYLEEYNPNHDTSSFWTCSEFCNIPLDIMQNVVGTDMGNILHSKCIGNDTTKFIDDNGGMTKTVSVEDSYKRGTIKTTQQIYSKLEELCIRLPHLLNDGKLDSNQSDLAYLSTIRITIRMKDVSNPNVKYPFVKKSKQCHFIHGKTLLCSNNEKTKASIVRNAI